MNPTMKTPLLQEICERGPPVAPPLAPRAVAPPRAPAAVAWKRPQPAENQICVGFAIQGLEYTLNPNEPVGAWLCTSGF